MTKKLHGACADFRDACVRQNSITELQDALHDEPDVADCRNWNISPAEWTRAIKAALAELGDRG